MENYEKIEKENKVLVSEFINYLTHKNLNTRTINRHESNIELLNDFLSGNHETKFQDADTYDIESFMLWCIDKWMFNRASEIESALNSIKIFFNYLQEKNIKQDIKEIIGACGNKDEYIKEFIKHERLLNEY